MKQYLPVKSNVTEYIYDIHALFGAFYPGYLIKVITPETKVTDREVQAVIAQEGYAFTLEILQNEIILTAGAQSYRCAIAPEHQGTSYLIKQEVKKFLYQSLSKHCDLQLPWGNLTGIRPTKIALTMLEEGRDDAQIKDFLQSEHFVSDAKAQLSIDIAKREQGLIRTLSGTRGYSIYIGIAFCPTTCLYCSFPSNPVFGFRERMDAYVAAIEKEIDYVAAQFAGRVLDTVYIGGGTPTTLSAQQLQRLIDKLYATLDMSTVKEFTVEAGRADSITEDKLRVLHEAKVTRISINPQTMNDRTLQLIGRRHSVQQVIDAFHQAREIGFTNINMDIILGLPGESEREVETTIREIEKLSPDSLTVHSLAIKKASKMQKWIEENGITTLQNTDGCMAIAAEGAARMGLLPYYLYRQKHMSGNFENTGYAKEGCFGLYNILIMEEVQSIVALGAGSISKHVYPDGRIERCENAKDVDRYLSGIDEMIERKKNLYADIIDLH